MCLLRLIIAVTVAGCMAFSTAQASGDYVLDKVEVTSLGNGVRKCVMEIVLFDPVDEGDLRQIARELEARRCSGIRPLFIGYRMADDPSDLGYFASTHFNPDLVVVIYR